MGSPSGRGHWLGFAAAVTVAWLIAPGCNRAPKNRTFELRGQILVVRAETRDVLIRHGDIPGFMPAMTMSYTVKDRALLEGREPGDLVTATLVVSSDAAWLSTITRTGSAPLPDDAPARVPAAAGVHVLQPGDAVPDAALTDQDGAEVSLARWRGSAIAVTFIYTQCPLPQFCPLMDRRFAEIQALSVSDPVLRGHVRLLSVSFDPARDTAAVLRAHAATLGADPAVWRFATAAEETVDRFAAAFGVNVIREADRTVTHNLRTAVIDRGGRVVVVHDGGAWTAAQLAGDLKRALEAGR